MENSTKKLLKKDNYKIHHRQASMELKYTSNDIKNVKSPNPNNVVKTIHAMKEMLFNNNVNANNGQKKGKIQNLNNNPNMTTLNAQTTSKNPHIPTSNNIILNQAGVPCFNNINIFTTNNPNSIKPHEINLRQYIFNKTQGKPKSLSKVASHIRGSSNNNHN